MMPNTPPPHRRRPEVTTLSVALTLVLLAACGGSSHGGTAKRAPSPAVTASATAPAAAPQAVAAKAPTTAVELRSDLEMLLGEHARLTVVLMRDRIGGTGPRTTATVAAVGRNADELSAAIGALYGASAGSSFGELWAAHVRQLEDYAAGLADSDAAARQQAKARLIVTEGDIGRLLSSAVGGRLPASAVAAAVKMHVDGLLQEADAYAAHDYSRAYALGRDAFGHMIGVADTLAGPMALSKGIAVTGLESPQRTLQSALSRLLAEHMGLMVEAMRAAEDSAPEFASAAQSLNANSQDLAAAIGALYGQAAARQFLQLWAGHVENLIAYARAARQHDAAGQATATQALGTYAERLAGFLAAATSGRLPATQLSGAITMHDSDLVQQADAYVAANFDQAQELASSGYRHMFDLAQSLALAIGNTVAARLPRGGVQTGGGGTAARR